MSLRRANKYVRGNAREQSPSCCTISIHRISSSSSGGGGGRDKTPFVYFSSTLFLCCSRDPTREPSTAHRHPVSCIDCLVHQPVSISSMLLLADCGASGSDRTRLRSGAFCAPSLRDKEHPLQQFSFPRRGTTLFSTSDSFSFDAGSSGCTNNTSLHEHFSHSQQSFTLLTELATLFQMRDAFA